MKSKIASPGFTAEIFHEKFLNTFKKSYEKINPFEIKSVIPQISFAPRLSSTRSINTKVSGTSNFSCNGFQCQCRGDADCNDLFSTGLCGDIASCDTGTGVCRCYRL